MENSVSIIIPTFNALRYLKRCVKSIIKYTTYPYELILVDNGSPDGTGDYLGGLSEGRMIKSREACLMRLKKISSRTNLGVSGALNKGISESKGKYICYLNDDVIVTQGWLEGLVRCSESHGNVGIVGASSNLMRGKNGRFPAFPGFRNEKELQNTSAAVSMLRSGIYEDALFVHGQCMFMKRGLVDLLGPFDEKYYPCGGEDIDYSYRARKAGYELKNAMDVFIFHFFGRATFSKVFGVKYGTPWKMFDLAKQRFVKKWGKQGQKYFEEIELGQIANNKVVL